MGRWHVATCPFRLIYTSHANAHSCAIHSVTPTKNNQKHTKGTLSEGCPFGNAYCFHNLLNLQSGSELLSLLLLLGSLIIILALAERWAIMILLANS